MSYQPEERYWTDYLRIALPAIGLLLLLGLFWWWGTTIIGGGDDDPPATQTAGVVEEVNAPAASPTATTAAEGVTPAAGAPPASPTPGQEAAAQPAEPSPTPGEPASAEDAAQDPPEANPGQSTTIPVIDVGSIATTDGAVNVRLEPSADSDLVVELDDGASVTITGEQVDDPDTEAGPEWYPVETETGESGYIREDLLQLAE